MTQASSIPTSAEKEFSEIYVKLVGVLFAVVLGFSFTLLVKPSQEGGLIDVLLAPLNNPLPFATLILSYTLVISSYIGYHVSTKEFPIRKPPRFAIDVMLLFLYYAVFANTANFGLVLILYTIIFFFYFLWNVIRVAEYWRHAQRGALIKRMFVSMIFFLCFLGLFGFNLVATGTTARDFLSGVLTVGLGIVFIVYRYLRPPGRKV